MNQYQDRFCSTSVEIIYPLHRSDRVVTPLRLLFNSIYRPTCLLSGPMVPSCEGFTFLSHSHGLPICIMFSRTLICLSCFCFFNLPDLAQSITSASSDVNIHQDSDDFTFPACQAPCCVGWAVTMTRPSTRAIVVSRSVVALVLSKTAFHGVRVRSRRLNPHAMFSTSK